ncbi:tRNA guanosine(34) transglycosylase Tgt [bacterium]|nr:tRNA guanosine(34) transglycosylase Tgt [bacterium]
MSMFDFKVIKRDPDSRARLGVLETNHGSVSTPVFMPVGTQGTVKTLSEKDLSDIGVEIILNNMYYLFLRPGVEIVKRLGGLHKFSSWEKAILTDSGGFQVFSLADLTKVNDEGVYFQSHLDGAHHFFTPELATQYQLDLGADIIMAFDECLPYPSTYQKTRVSTDRTINWAERCLNKYRELTAGDAEESDMLPALFGIVQGSTYLDLRKYCADKLVGMEFPGYALGGLFVGEPKAETFGIIDELSQFLPREKPLYLMGFGTPVDLLEAISMGADMFDCVMPTRNARNGSVFTWKGKLSIKAARYAEDVNPIDQNCGCYTCRTYSRAYVRHLFSAGELLGPHLATLHSIYFFHELMAKAREAIKNGEFLKFRKEFSENYRENDEE